MDPLESCVLGLERFLENKAALASEHPLRYLFWEATLRCNLSCRHCGSDCVRDDSKAASEIPPYFIKRELDAIAARSNPRQMTLAIIGGEPLLRQDIEEVGAYAASLGFTWGITTNGMLLDQLRLASLKAAGLKTISVSLDGLEAAHDRLRRHNGAFQHVLEVLRRLVADPFYGAFDVICCVNALNIDHLGPFVDLLESMGVPQVRFTPVFSRGRAGRDFGLMLSDSHYRRLLDFAARERASRRGISVTLSEEGYWGPEWECRVREGLHYCGSGTVIGSILHDGSIMGCPSVSRRFIEGHIGQERFIDVWGKKFSRYRQGRRQSAPNVCGTCEEWDLCEGGGFHLFDPEDKDAETCSLRKIADKGESHA